MEANRFEITGKVTFVDIKTFDSGAMKTRILISKKGKKEGEYDSYAVTLWGDTVDIPKGEYVNVVGRLGKNKFTDKNNNQRDEIDLIGTEYTIVTWDSNAKSYVPKVANDKKPWD